MGRINTFFCCFHTLGVYFGWSIRSERNRCSTGNPMPRVTMPIDSGDLATFSLNSSLLYFVSMFVFQTGQKNYITNGFVDVSVFNFLLEINTADPVYNRKKSACFKRVPISTELFINGNKCTLPGNDWTHCSSQ